MYKNILDEIYIHLNNIVTKESRLFDDETRCAIYIIETLGAKKKAFIIQPYNTHYPYFKDWKLLVNWNEIESYPCSFTSWTITSEQNIFNALEKNENYSPWICYNSKSKGISIPHMYFAPTLSISYKNFDLISKGCEINWFVKVEKKHFFWKNIIVGNTHNPEKVLICHYDSWFNWACDNWIWVSLLLSILSLIDTNKFLILFAWSEEVSYDYPYWWYWYRKFEEKYSKALLFTKEIIVFDSFWFWKNITYTDPALIKSAFSPINYDLLYKTKVYSSEIEWLMEIYHSSDDTIEKINNIDIWEIIKIIHL